MLVICMLISNLLIVRIGSYTEVLLSLDIFTLKQKLVYFHSYIVNIYFNKIYILWENVSEKSQRKIYLLNIPFFK